MNFAEIAGIVIRDACENDTSSYRDDDPDVIKISVQDLEHIVTRTIQQFSPVWHQQPGAAGVYWWHSGNDEDGSSIARVQWSQAGLFVQKTDTTTGQAEFCKDVGGWWLEIIEPDFDQPAQNEITQYPHADDVGVDMIASAMKRKLAACRANGKSGWNDLDRCPTDRLRNLLRTNKDPVDIANYSMMLFCRGERLK